MLRHRIGTADLNVLLDKEGVYALERALEDLRSAGIVEKGPAEFEARELTAREIDI